MSQERGKDERGGPRGDVLLDELLGDREGGSAEGTENRRKAGLFSNRSSA